ncbi:hypothetical protein AWB83_03056 [Caballeronia ptereochthonis]|jgi:hypothetical protein|uniref:Uncharacterized protein n=1 Tax=Caballeronia ptereochthonis TaxID=1777144 RepID=A0A158BAN3_9BURK|nr:hypothetical protein AWB83_03056 [Caballeronia ptereochthonis]
MIPALLETIGVLSLLVSVAAKIALLRDPREDDAPEAPAPAARPPVSVRAALACRATCRSPSARMHNRGSPKRCASAKGASRRRRVDQCAPAASGGRPSGSLADS